MFRRISLILVLLSLVGCAPRTLPPNLTPTQQTQYIAAVTSDQTVTRVNELMNVVITAESNGGISTPAARVIVKFCVDADTVLKEVPSGWQITVAKLWLTVKANPIVKPFLSNVYISVAVSLVDAAIDSWGK